MGLPFLYQITATVNPSSYGPLEVYSPGLTYDQSRGLISGTPTSASAIVGTISASAAGGTGSEALLVNIAHDLAATLLGTSPVIGSLVPAPDGSFYAVSGDGIYQLTAQGAVALLCVIPAVGTGTDQDATALVQGTDGNLYGTTSDGGANNLGTFFRVTPAGEVTTLYQFGASDGGTSNSALVKGSDGNFYGTLGEDDTGLLGTIIQLTPAGVLTVLHRFDGVTDGQEPSGLILAPDGNFYGTTRAGGPGNGGTIFKMTPAGVLTTIQAFSTGGSRLPRRGVDAGAGR